MLRIQIITGELDNFEAITSLEMILMGISRLLSQHLGGAAITCHEGRSTMSPGHYIRIPGNNQKEIVRLWFEKHGFLIDEDDVSNDLKGATQGIKLTIRQEEFESLEERFPAV